MDQQLNNEPQVSQPAAPTKPKKPFFKNKLFILATALIAVLLTIGISYLFVKDDELELATDPAPAFINITDTEFTPQTIKINKDTTVIWDNVSSTGKRIAAEPYPSGDSLPNLDSEELIPPGESYSYVFDTVGTYNYYEYSNPTEIKGTIIVE